MKRALTTIATLVAAQALMLGIWFAVEHGRAPSSAPEAPLGVAAFETTRIDRPMPDLELQRPDGGTFRLSEARGQPLLLHFWATWCPPCRDELPALLAYAAEGDMSVLAVSLDSDWAAIRRFLGPTPQRPVVLAAGGDVEEAFDVGSLPVTFVVDADGRLRMRLDGPRDWSAPAVRATVREGSN